MYHTDVSLKQVIRLLNFHRTHLTETIISTGKHDVKEALIYDLFLNDVTWSRCVSLYLFYHSLLHPLNAWCTLGILFWPNDSNQVQYYNDNNAVIIIKYREICHWHDTTASEIWLPAWITKYYCAPLLQPLCIPASDLLLKYIILTYQLNNT